MLDSRYHKYNKKLPGRYLSELSPNSMPLADAKVHLARARLAFQKKLRRLDTQFKLADDNGNGLMPPKGIIKCLERADIVLPDKYVKKIIAQSQLPDPDPSTPTSASARGSARRRSSPRDGRRAFWPWTPIRGRTLSSRPILRSTGSSAPTAPTPARISNFPAPRPTRAASAPKASL